MRGYGMKAINQPAWLEKEKPVAGELDAIVRPTLVAPCSSDVHTMHGGSGPKTDMILGHEALGEIVEVGRNVKNFKPGDIVVVPAGTPDWTTQGIQAGKSSFSHDHGRFGSFKFTTIKDGTFAEFFHVNMADSNLVHLPKDMNPEAALMTVDMASTGFSGVELAEVGFGDTVVVMGIGPVGLMAIAGAQLRGAGRIIAIGTRPNCIKIAKEYGATDIISYKDGDVVQQVKELTNGGADKVIIAGGGQESLCQAVAMIQGCGIVSNVNYFDVTETFTMPTYVWGLGMSNIDIRGGFCPGGALRIKKLLNVIEYGRIDMSKIVSHRYDGFEKIEDAFKLMDEKPADLIKPVISINW